MAAQSNDPTPSNRETSEGGSLEQLYQVSRVYRMKRTEGNRIEDVRIRTIRCRTMVQVQQIIAETSRDFDEGTTMVLDDADHPGRVVLVPKEAVLTIQVEWSEDNECVDVGDGLARKREDYDA